MMNNVSLVGRLTKDPELRYTPDGTGVANFTLAVDRGFTGNDGKREADFIPIVVWRKPAEACAEHLKKGRLVAVCGRIQVRSYANREGERRYATEIIAARVQFLEKKNGPSSETPTPGTDIDQVFTDDDVPF